MKLNVEQAYLYLKSYNDIVFKTVFFCTPVLDIRVRLTDLWQQLGKDESKALCKTQLLWGK